MPVAVWSDVLHRMEQDIAAAMSGEAPVSWEPPAGLGRMPPEMEGRARQILDAQVEAAGIMGHSLRETTKHIHAIQSIPEPPMPRRWAILDVTA